MIYSSTVPHCLLCLQLRIHPIYVICRLIDYFLDVISIRQEIEARDKALYG